MRRLRTCKRLSIMSDDRLNSLALMHYVVIRIFIPMSTYFTYWRWQYAVYAINSACSLTNDKVEVLNISVFLDIHNGSVFNNMYQKQYFHFYLLQSVMLQITI